MSLKRGLIAALLACLAIGCQDSTKPDSARTARGGSASAAQDPSGRAAPVLSFAQLPPGPALEAAGKPHLADFNGDGLLDLASVRSTDGRAESRLRIAYGDGQGGFDINQTVAIPFPGVHCLASGDFNADGAIDLALVAHDSYNVWLLFNSGQGGLSLSPQALAMHRGQHPHTHSLSAADMNGDGLADILSGCADDNAVAVQLQQADGGFAPAAGSPFAAGTHPYENLTVADFNGDKRLDVAVPNLMGDNLSVLLGDGIGALEHAADGTLPAAQRPGYLACGDLDGDSALDIVSTHDDRGLLALYYGDGKGGFTPNETLPLSLPSTCWAAALADLDGDGGTELIVAEIGGDLLIYSGGRHSSALPSPRRVRVTGGELMYLLIADLNRDGKQDFVTNCWDNGNCAVILQQ